MTALSADAPEFFPQPRRSEGSALSMGGAEVEPPRWLACVPEVSSTKPHGCTPSLRLSSHWPNTHQSTVKRSRKRAYRRACAHGFSWYKGQCLTPPQDFPDLHHLPASSQVPALPPERKLQPNRAHAPASRFKLLLWNPGGLSTERFREFVRCSLQQLDLICLCETRWQYESEWDDPYWNFIRSGHKDPQDRACGMLIMIAKRLCKPHDISWTPIIHGRLAHLRLQFDPRSLDIICGYQFVDHPNQSQKQNRQQWWDKLERQLQILPSRNGQLLLGDFNCQLPHIPGLSGPPQFWFQDSLISGPQHSDQSEFQRIIRDHTLVSLTTWNAKDGPTFRTDAAGSRIDHIFCNRGLADQSSKSCRYLTDARFMPDSGCRHMPLICILPRPKIKYNSTGSSQAISYQQKLRCREAWHQQTDQWNQFQRQTSADISNLRVSDGEQCPVEALRQKAQQAFHACFPRTARIHEAKCNEGILSAKWSHYHKIKSISLTDLMEHPLFRLFDTWKHVVSFRKVDRSHKKWVFAWKKQQIQQSIDTADHAASAYNSFTLYRTVNLFTPRRDRRKVRLRNKQGGPAGPVETVALLKEYVQNTWSGPQLTLPWASCAGCSF